jgi:hypothetical protein
MGQQKSVGKDGCPALAKSTFRQKARRRRIRRWTILGGVSIFLLAIVVFQLAGCGEKQARMDLTPEEQHILQFMRLYSYYRNAHSGKVPASPKEIKDWVNGLKENERKQIPIEDLDKAFISPRDGQPYDLAPPPPPQMRGMSKVVVFEHNGVAGEKLAVGSLGNVSRLRSN